MTNTNTPSRVARKIAASEWGRPDTVERIALTGTRYAADVQTPGHGGIVAVVSEATAARVGAVAPHLVADAPLPTLIGEEDCDWAALLWLLGPDAVEDYRRARPHLHRLTPEAWADRVRRTVADWNPAALTDVAVAR